MASSRRLVAWRSRILTLAGVVIALSVIMMVAASTEQNPATAGRITFGALVVAVLAFACAVPALRSFGDRAGAPADER